MALTRHPVIHAILEQLLGEPCRLIQDMALLKPPHIGTEKPWHQDMAYFGWGPPEKVLGVWVALDPATAENGCMHVLPGTHREGPVPHVHARDCQIPDENVQTERDVMVPLEPGGALFFASLLHHGTPPNESPNRRWAIQYHYAAARAVRVDKAAHAAMYFNGDLYAGCRAGTGVPVSEMKGD
jgi:phytanoyl-CoA hydroxylase